MANNPLAKFANATLKVPVASSGPAIQDADGNYVAPAASNIEVKALLKGFNSSVGASLSRGESPGVDQSRTYLSGRLVDPNYLPFDAQFPLECECELKSGMGLIQGRIQLEVAIQEAFAGRKVEDKIGQSVGGFFYIRGASDG